MTPEDQARIQRDVQSGHNEVINPPWGVIKVLRMDGHPILGDQPGIGVSVADFRGGRAVAVIPLSQALTLRVLLDSLLEDYVEGGGVNV